MWYASRYALFHLLLVIACVAFLSGGWYIPLSFASVILVLTVGDFLSGNDDSMPDQPNAWLYNSLLFLALPLLVLFVLCVSWQISDTDILSIGDLVHQITGIDILAARQQTTTCQLLAGLPYAGLMVATAGTVTAHELVHRTWHTPSVVVGRWLLAFSFDANFSIEHVFGHHKNVATRQDPASAPRERNVYQHIWRSTLAGNVSAWRIECQRLARRKLAVWSYHNTCLRGYAMSALLVAGIWWLAGSTAALYISAIAINAKTLLEIVNYVEHYGLIRIPGTRVEPRHSWNSNRRLSCWTLFNLPRHAHHHAQASVPYQKLKPYHDAPELPSGYLSCIFLALVPPLWRTLMTPRLQRWDTHYASPEERKLAQQSN